MRMSDAKPTIPRNPGTHHKKTAKYSDILVDTMKNPRETFIF